MAVNNSTKAADFFKQYQRDVFGISFYILKDQQISEDVVMETFEVVLNHKDLNSIEKPKLWLLGTARNLAFKKIRQSKKEMLSPNNDNLENCFVEFDLDQTHLDKEKLIDKLLVHLNSLKFYQSKCLHLFYLQRKSYDEISKSLNLDLNKVKSHIQNGKRNLKIRLEKELVIND